MTYTTTHVTCPACGHRLTEIGTEEVDNHYLCLITDYEGPPLTGPFVPGCGKEWDYDGTPWVPR